MELHQASSREDSIPCLQPSQEHGGCRMRVEENCKRERVKWKRRREEWSGCVTDCLLDAYEDKLKSLDCGNSRRRHREEVGLSSGPNPTWGNTQFFLFACHNCSVLFAQNSNLNFAIIDL